MALTALGVQAPQINGVQNFNASQANATAQAGEQQAQKRAAYQALAENALGLMGGRLDGEVNMEHFGMFRDMLEKSGNPLAAKLTPELVPVIARGSLAVMQAGQDQQRLDIAEKQFQLELDKFNKPAAAPAPSPTDDMKELAQINAEREASGQELLTMEAFLGGKGGNGLTMTLPDGTVVSQGGAKGINAYDVEDAKAKVKLAGDIAAEGRSGSSAVATLGKMREAMADPDFYSGAGGNTVLQLKRAAKAIGLDPGGVESAETFNALSKKAALETMGGSLGTGFSNADRDFIIEQVPNMGNTPEGNAALIDVQIKIAERKVDIANFAADYKKERGGRLDWEFDDKLAEWAEQNPLFADDGGDGDGPDADVGPTIPKAGDVEDGFRFKGGDPGDQSNWEAVN